MDRRTSLSTASVALATLFVLVVPIAARAQAPVTATDLSRLEATVKEIDQQAEALKKTDATLAADVAKRLTDLSDEVTYLKVKLRREGSVTREDYASVRDRLETLRVRAQGPGGAEQRVTAQPAIGEPEVRASGTVPVGAQFDVRLQTPLNSGTAKVEQRFEATTVLDYKDGAGRVLVPAGTLVRGFVSSVRAAGRIDRKGSLTLSFDEIRIDQTSQRLRASITSAMDGKMTDDTARIGAGAVVGAIIGGIIGGGKGALVGVLVGGGGTIASTEGSDVDLTAGTILRIRLDQALDVK